MNNGDILVNQGTWNTETQEFDGLTKREHFAAMAMQGIMANSQLADAFNNDDEMFSTIVKVADGVLAALEKSQCM